MERVASFCSPCQVRRPPADPVASNRLWSWVPPAPDRGSLQGGRGAGEEPCAPCRGAGALTGTVTAWRGVRNKGGIRALRSEPSPPPAGLPKAGEGCGAALAPRREAGAWPLGAGLSERPLRAGRGSPAVAGAAGAGCVCVWGGFRVAETPCSWGQARLPLGCLTPSLPLPPSPLRGASGIHRAPPGGLEPPGVALPLPSRQPSAPAPRRETCWGSVWSRD